MVVCGDVWWFAVMCGGLWWFVVVCGGLSFSHTLCTVTESESLCLWGVVLLESD